MIMPNIAQRISGDKRMPRSSTFAKRAGLGLFLFFLVKGLVWLVVLGVAAVGVSKI